MSNLEVRFDADQFRSLPVPGQTLNGKPTKLYTCFVDVEELPSELGNWMQVNPRMPARREESEEVTGRVANRIMTTLRESPELFALKNQGIYLLVERAEHIKEPGGKAYVRMMLSDPKKHGIVNGGHTFFSIQQVIRNDELGSSSPAYVRLHIMESIDPTIIVDLAEGLNRSLQVKDASLSNLEGQFDKIKKSLAGKCGANEISYHMGQDGAVDIQDVLAQMSAMNIKMFPDEGKHPNTIFGQPAKVLQAFLNDMKSSSSANAILIPKLHDILVLFERVAEETAKHTQKTPRLGGLGKKRGKDLQAKNPRETVFSEGRTIERRYFAGLVYPIFSAFRANVDPGAWAKGKFKWIVDPETLLMETIDQLCDVVSTAYYDNRSDPAVVGKKQATYLACYQLVLLKLARRGKLAAA